MSDGFHDDELNEDEEPAEDALLASEDTEEDDAPEGTLDEEDVPFVAEDDESTSTLDKFGFTENRDELF